jgi:hypothetical protein
MKSIEKKYIGITQGCTGISKMSEEISDNFLGFYTERIASCLGIVLFHKNEHEISQITLLHYDYTQSEDQVKQILTQEGVQIKILRNEAYWRHKKSEDEEEYNHSIKAFERFEKLLQDIPVTPEWIKLPCSYMDNFYFYVRRDGEILYTKQIEGVEFILNNELHHAFNMLNAAVKAEIYKTPIDINLVYDNGWVEAWVENNLEFCGDKNILKDLVTFAAAFPESNHILESEFFERYISIVNTYIDKQQSTNNLSTSGQETNQFFSVFEEEKEQKVDGDNSENNEDLFC